METLFEKLEIVRYIDENSKELSAKIEVLYRACEHILGEIPKEFSNYTKHDIGHSIRVIGYMNELVKDSMKKFSCLHLAMIVFAGLLHDTGMFVSDEEKQELYSKFLEEIPAFTKMTDKEKQIYLQDYIRENHGKRVSKVIEQNINADTKLKSILYYDQAEMEIYSVLTKICQAHMEESEWISKNLRDHEWYGEECINPRHIAVLLRIGDMLDIDRNRAPYVLYCMLKPEGYSDTEWKKHAPITNFEKIINKEGLYRILFSGKTEHPDIYRKVEGYIDYCQKQLEKDLLLCVDEYELKIQLPIIKDIDTIGFERTSFKFVMDYKQISKLLTGERLYGSKKEGLRELLQNAIDAVLVMKEIESKKLYSNYAPLICLDIDKDKNSIIVVDNGIGMSEEILINFFFNIGNSYYESKAFNKNAYTYRPIGHFGIGFLACFMLSSKITLETYHHESKKYIKMDFEKESPFVIKYKTDGETFDLDHGTKIHLKYDEVIPEVFKTVEDLEKYIKDILLFNNFTLKIYNHGEKNIDLKQPQHVYQDSDEIIEYEFDWHRDRRSFIYNMETFFNRIQDVYIVDNLYNDVISLYDLTRYFNELDISFKIIKEEMEKSELLDAVMKRNSRYDRFFFSFVNKNYKTILRSSQEKDGLFSLLLDYLTSFIDEDVLSWYTVEAKLPQTLYSELDKKLEAREFFSGKREMVLLCKGTMSSQELEKVYKDIEKKYTVTDFSAKSVRNSVNVMRIDGKPHNFIVIDTGWSSGTIVYVKGIMVDGMRFSIRFPYFIKDFGALGILCNLKTGNYMLDVSRKSFAVEDIEKIEKKMSCLIYSEALNDDNVTDEEKQYVEKFLKTYYSEEYKYLQENKKN